MRAAALRPPDGVRLPGPSLGLPLLGAAVLLMIAAPFTGALVLVAGVVVLALAGLRIAAELRREGRPYDRRTVLAARRVTAFGARHASRGAATVRVAMESLGQGQCRLVLLGADGTFGDLVVSGADRAQAVIELASAEHADASDRDFAGRIRTSRYEWAGMTDSQLRRH